MSSFRIECQLLFRSVETSFLFFDSCWANGPTWGMAPTLQKWDHPATVVMETDTMMRWWRGEWCEPRRFGGEGRDPLMFSLFLSLMGENQGRVARVFVREKERDGGQRSSGLYKIITQPVQRVHYCLMIISIDYEMAAFHHFSKHCLRTLILLFLIINIIIMFECPVWNPNLSFTLQYIYYLFHTKGKRPSKMSSALDTWRAH